ncbi:uncharacterized protein LOC144860670 [Branchiostoma floridae x Branchiostoma japonicum]
MKQDATTELDVKAATKKDPATTRHKLVHPNDRVQKGTKSDVIYRLKCEGPQCNDTYIGETSQPLKARTGESINHVTQERMVDTVLIDPKIQPVNVIVKEETLKITWPDGHQSEYGLNWLLHNTYEGQKHVCGTMEPFLWNAATLSASPPPRVQYQDYLRDDRQLAKFLHTLLKYGFAFIEDAPATMEATLAAAERISHVRETFFGRHWFVTSDFERHDTGYTTAALPVHMDNTHFNEPSGLIVSHMLEEGDSGGTSLLVDGFHAAERLRQDDPEGLLVSHMLEEGDSGGTSVRVDGFHAAERLRQDDPEGLLVSHMLEEGDSGGISVLVDGFHAAERLRQDDPEGFDVLSSVPVPHHYLEPKLHMRAAGPIVELEPGSRKEIKMIRYSMYDRAVLDTIPMEDVGRWYSALRRFTNYLRDSSNEYWFQLKPDSSRKLESTPQQRFEMMVKAQREVDIYLEQLRLDHPTGWVIPPGCSIQGPDQVQSGRDQVQSGRDQVQSGPDQVQAGPDQVQSGPDQVQSGPDQVQSGPDQVQSGPDQVQSGPDQVQSGPDQVQSGPDQVQSGPDQVQSGPGQVQSSMPKEQWEHDFRKMEPLPIQEHGVSIDVALRDFSRLGDEMERDGHPGHMAYVPGNSTAPAAIGDFLAASFNPYSTNVGSCRRAVKLQQLIVQWVGRLFGYPDTCAGNLTSGGTVATMVAMATARDQKVPRSKDYSRSVLYVTELTHDGVAKCLTTLGMREAVVRKVPVDDRYEMDVNTLQTIIQHDLQADLLPFLVVATVGTTDAGSVDPVPAIRAVATRYNLWLHVDACYGGFFALCNSVKHLFEGVETADSIAVDPHKGLYVPLGTGVVLVRNGALLRNSHIRQPGNYLQDQFANPEDWNPEDLTFEQSAHFRAPRVLLPLHLYGVSTFRDALQEKLELAKYLYLQLKDQQHIEVVKPVFTIVLFRIPDVSDHTNRCLLRKITADGRFFLRTTTVKGALYLRANVFAIRTHRQDVDVFINRVMNAVVEIELSGTLTSAEH